ncbi:MULTISPECIES: L,D-transpeptidase [Shinella]|uniref:L,D-transpeptidase family protein n=1 Tax=Shinella zoogloeoides TaxID=352475 RepID=A0A6N8TF83_SHIZO|nr:MULTISPECIES: L,D-transpeptidase [Shinella]MBP8938580.1 L,D-transpeptidase [Agrobacterium sp.]EYR82725.1 ErfK/YbiS/YcfS/YnhG [Shinella sp. DD12]MCW5712058.1 L,D-transpeptidase [Shinella sp.]MXO01937.1 L,D-transpeptidase family protein [Shinella zoogloeoides]TAA51302.1 L,D-transpeptidase [Shinella sp. JR1-6]
MRRLSNHDTEQSPTAERPASPVLDRRTFGLAAVALLASPALAVAQGKKHTIDIDERFLPQLVTSPYPETAGTIVVVPRDRFLYLIEEGGLARRYGVGVGRAGLAFSGTATVGRKAKWPSWRPTDNMIRRDPKKYARYADGVPGGPKNPLGSRALYLFRDGRDTLYRIHGTTEPWTIGKAVSNGCIRMVNGHVEDLYERVPVGTRVVVVS